MERPHTVARVGILVSLLIVAGGVCASAGERQYLTHYGPNAVSAMVGELAGQGVQDAPAPAILVRGGEVVWKLVSDTTDELGARHIMYTQYLRPSGYLLNLLDQELAAEGIELEGSGLGIHTKGGVAYAVLGTQYPSPVIANEPLVGRRHLARQVVRDALERAADRRSTTDEVAEGPIPISARATLILAPADEGGMLSFVWKVEGHSRARGPFLARLDAATGTLLDVGSLRPNADPPCTISLTRSEGEPTIQPVGGREASYEVTTASNCYWIITQWPSAAWITNFRVVVGSMSGSGIFLGPGQVKFTVQANTTFQRREDTFRVQAIGGALEAVGSATVTQAEYGNLCAVSGPLVSAVGKPQNDGNGIQNRSLYARIDNVRPSTSEFTHVASYPPLGGVIPQIEAYYRFPTDYAEFYNCLGKQYGPVPLKQHSDGVVYYDKDDDGLPENIGSAVGDGIYFTKLTMQAFANLFGRFSYDGNGSVARLVFNNPGGTDTGFWAGANSGDLSFEKDQYLNDIPGKYVGILKSIGSGTGGEPGIVATVDLDLLAHEWGHAIFHTVTGITYVEFGVGGQLSEGYADLFAHAVEWTMQPAASNLDTPEYEHADWLITEDLCRSQSSSDRCYSIEGAACRRRVDKYNTNGAFHEIEQQRNSEVHYNGQVLPVAFRLLSGRGVPDDKRRNPGCYSSPTGGLGGWECSTDVPELGLEKAAKIFYYTLYHIPRFSTPEWKRMADYAKAAAAELYPGSSYEQDAVAKTFKAIGYSGTAEPEPCTGPYSISGTVRRAGVGEGSVRVTTGSCSAVSAYTGEYTIVGVADHQAYTVIVGGTDMALPSSRPVYIDGGNVGGQDFTLVTKSVSGRVTLFGQGVPGAYVWAQYYGGAYTDGRGNYTIALPDNVWAFYIYPTDPLYRGYTFTPAGTQVGVTGNYCCVNFEATPNLAYGLVGQWKLDEGSGSTAYDSSGNNNTGYLTYGPAWAAGRIGNGVSFGGVYNQSVQVADSPALSPTSAVTIAAWVKVNGTASGFAPISVKEVNGNPRSWWFGVYTTGGTQYLYSSNSGLSSWDLYAAMPSALNTWRHVAFTYGAGGRRLYVDGVLIASDAATGSIPDTPAVLYIGGWAGAPSFNGVIDDVRIYNRALVGMEVQMLADAGAGLVARWKFDEDSGPLAYDSSGNNNRGTLLNEPVRVAGKSGNAVNLLSTSNQFVRADSWTGLPLGNSARTMMAWINPASYPDATYNGIVSYGPMACNNGATLAIQNTGRLSMAFYCNDAFQTVGPTVPLNTWTHVAMTYPGGNTVRFYLNGQFVQETTVSAGTPASTTYGPIRIGSTDNPGRTFNGAIDDVQIYDRALSDEEIRAVVTSAGGGPVITPGDHPRTVTAASSCVGGCDSPSWTHGNLIDSSAAVAWSSVGQTIPDGYQWFAFWFDGPRDTNYLRIVPRTYNGQNNCVPERITIYYSANGTWNPTGITMNLNADIPQDGYTVWFPTVHTDGLLVVSDRFRTDAYGRYYFQIAEAYGGLGQ